MKKAVILFIALVFAAPANSSELSDLWQKYAERAQIPESVSTTPAQPVGTPGRIIGEPQGDGESAFDYQWKYRPATCEIHFQEPATLAHSIYGLALYAGDISTDLPREKFYSGVNGFHYSTEQTADWLNASVRNGIPLTDAESVFVGALLADKCLHIGPHGFAAGEGIEHILGAAPGKKRSFDQNLRHERLHVFWDEDGDFRANRQKAWQNLSEAEKANIRADLKNYNQSNEAQLMEEWAIKDAEKSGMSIK